MPKYNHAYTIGFSLVSEHPDGKDVSPDMLRAALLIRINDLDASRPDKSEWHEAVGAPFDTYEEE